jgi:hypothetical protein
MEPSYRIWGVDGIVYGPVDLPTLIGWVEEDRVLNSTWVYADHQDTWRKAGDYAELGEYFSSGHTRTYQSVDTQFLSQIPGMKPGALRRIKIFAGFSDEQLGRFMKYIELKKFRQFTDVVRQGDPGDAMFMVLEGEVRVRLMIGGKESMLTVLGPGEFFGEMTLFDHGPRSADVVTNLESVFLRMGAAAFQRLACDAPDLATPFLLAVSKTLTSRIRADNKRFRDSVAFARSSQ